MISEDVFDDDSPGSTFVSTSRYPVRSCETNNTYVDFSSVLTAEQHVRVNNCVSTYKQDFEDGLVKARANQELRWSIHSYLNNKSFMIEAGGHKGLDVSEFNSRYHPGTYIVLEPVTQFYNVLKDKFKSSPNVVIYKFGVDVTDGVFYVNEDNNDGANIFAKKHSGKETLTAAKIVKVSRFFEKLYIMKRDVDLITLDCEGCEFAILDLLLSTDYVHHFRNIQFQPHNLPSLCYPIKRFCWYQELLQLTHQQKFQFKFVWESWSRK